MFAVFAHPADLFGRYAHHQCIGFDVFVYHRASTDEGKLSDSGAADDGAVGAQRGAFLDQCVAVFVFALDQRSRVIDVGEDHAGAAEDAFFEGDVVVNRDVVLDFAVVADDDFVADEDVLAERHALANPGAAANVNPMPDAAAFADLCAIVNDGGGVDGDIGHGFSMNGLADFVGQRDGGRPLATQYGDKLVCAVEGIFARSLAGVLGAAEQGAKAGEGVDDIRLNIWKVMHPGIQQIVLFFWAALDGLV